MWIKIPSSWQASINEAVTSFTLVWIKMNPTAATLIKEYVTSFTLVWIKIIYATNSGPAYLGHELHARVD